MPNQTEGWMKTNMHGAGFQKLEEKIKKLRVEFKAYPGNLRNKYNEV